MRYSRLPNTDIKVSKICLGTMTFGKQNNDDGLIRWIMLSKWSEFFDTAELYQYLRQRNQGNTEK